MSKLFSAREIATQSLRMIGVVSPNDTGATEGQLGTALNQLDLILSEKSGTRRLPFLQPQNVTFTWPANAASVNLTSLLGATPLDMIRYAYKDTTAEPISLLTRQEWELARNGMYWFEYSSGMFIATDGDDSYTAYWLPVPTLDTVIRIDGTQFSATVAGINKSSSTAEQAHGFEKAWQRWMEFILACDLGDGILARLPLDRLNRWEAKAEAIWAELISVRGGGQRKNARFVRPWTK